MRRKNLAATIATMLCAISFIVIGSCFSAFIYKKEMIVVQNPKIFKSEGIEIFDEEGDKAIDEFKLSKMPLGLKPATGDEDQETAIPSTVHSKKGSEGHYAIFKAYAPAGAKVIVKNVKIDTKKPEKVIAERENIKIAIAELKVEAKSLAEDEVEIGTLSASDERQEFTLLIWLSSKAGDDLKGAKISFDVYFVG